jgi:putative ABC transport system ATP-binding protein
MNVIELENVRKDYPLGATTVHALRGVSLAIKEGDFISIVGPSGSGKTTLLNIVGCIDNATEGSVKIHGKEVTTHSDRRLTDLRLHTIGFIFQTFNLIPVLSARENVEFPLLLMKKENLSNKEIRRRAEKLLEEVGLKEQMNQKPFELSGGQRQRVAIARALVTKPAIVLADEPTANLDSETGEMILKQMKELNLLEKTTFVFSTHDRTFEIRQRRAQDQRRADGELGGSDAGLQDRLEEHPPAQGQEHHHRQHPVPGGADHDPGQRHGHRHAEGRGGEHRPGLHGAHHPGFRPGDQGQRAVHSHGQAAEDPAGLRQD